MSAKFRAFQILGVAALCALAVSCDSGGTSKGSTSVKPGTPAYYWAAAGQTYRNGDFVKTVDNLSKIPATSEYKPRSEPWHLVLASGMAQGYIDLADRYDTGGKSNKAAAIGFQKMVIQYRAAANTANLDFAETLHSFMATNKDAEIKLDFSTPSGLATEPPEIGKVVKGILPPEAEILSTEKAMLRRGVMIATANAIGAKDDGAKAVETFKAGDVKVPREVFMRAMARNLYDRAQIYLPKTLDQPKRLQVLCHEAAQALSSLPQQTKEDKELAKKIQDTLKKYKLDS